MKKYTRILWILLALPLLFACGSDDVTDTADTVSADTSFKMTARITAVAEKIEVDVIEGAYGATGPYWVNTSDTTVYRDKDGTTIKRRNLCEGDTVEITYSGQVMMSYPPQIVALSITKK